MGKSALGYHGRGLFTSYTPTRLSARADGHPIKPQLTRIDAVSA